MKNNIVSDILFFMLSDIVCCTNEELLKSIHTKKRELDCNRPLNTEILRKLDEQFSIEWTYNSNAIEGNTISFGETNLILEKGITIGKKTLREHFEILNHDKAIKLLSSFVQKKQQLSVSFIKELHQQILTNIDDTQAGRFRTFNVRITGAFHLPPRYEKVESLMEELVAFYNEKQYSMDIVELAAIVHYYFVYIHPFSDGNGRTARLVMNLILMKAGYPPAIILNIDRHRYLTVLNNADKGNFKTYFNFIARSVERTLTIYLDSCTKNGKNAEYISLSEASKLCPYSQEYLSLLARKNKLPCIKFNRNWMTTLDALKEYVEAQGKKLK